jgi:transcriptional regulator with XRE-family HTH domain
LTNENVCAIIVLCLKHNTTKKETEKMKMTLKGARVNAGFTLDDVAVRLKKSKNTLIAYEKGRRMPDVETGKALASLYGCTVDDIIFLPKHCALSTEKKGGNE